MRILVVDDDPINRFLLVNMLEQQGYVDTFEAENGLEAIAITEQINPDLVLLDAIMPEMDGYEAAPLLKEMAGDIYLPVIFITAVEDQEGLAKCLEVGGDDFVSKPYDKIILAAKIRAHARTRTLSKRSFEQNKQLSVFQNAVEREHKIVEHIFDNALVIDNSLGKYIDYQLNPASTFNGDLFLMCASPSGGIYFLMGDFTGHGLASSIGALPVSQAFNTMCRKGLSLMEIAETINQTLLMLLPDDMFFAAILVEIDCSGKRIDVWNGGMPHLVLIDSFGQIVKRFYSQHMSLGILEPEDFEDTVERYEADYGDQLVGFSDGLAEIENGSGQLLGDTGVEHWLLESPTINIQTIVDKAKTYLGGGDQVDDITLVHYTCQKLKDVVLKTDIANSPLKIISEVAGEELKDADPIGTVVDVIANQLGLFHHHSALFTALSELYNNALDHGVLGLDSELKQSENGFFDYFMQRQDLLEQLTEGKIVVKTEFSPKDQRLYFEISDSGSGFDPNTFAAIDDTEKSYGRGIALVKEICESVEYFDGGTRVKVSFVI